MRAVCEGELWWEVLNDLDDHSLHLSEFSVVGPVMIPAFLSRWSIACAELLWASVRPSWCFRTWISAAEYTRYSTPSLFKMLGSLGDAGVCFWAVPWIPFRLIVW
jgi:hypothetical protein